MPSSDELFNDLLLEDDLTSADEVEEDDAQEQDPLGLNEFASVSEPPKEESVVTEEPTEPTTSNFVQEYLKGFGIEDMTKIQMQNEDGEVEEVDFNSLSEDEKLNIFRELSNPGYSDYEKQVIEYLRRNNATLDDVAEFYKKQGVEEYLSQHPEDVHQRVYNIDEYTDDEVYLADLKNKYPEFTDEELVEKLDSAKVNTELFAKEVAAIRTNLKNIEDEERKQQEEQEAQSYQELQNNLQAALSGFTQIELDPDDKEQDALALEVTDEDRAVMMRYLIERDKDGKSQLVRDLENPNALIELAYYRTRERDNLTGLTRYWKNELANERKEKAKLQKELDKLKNKGNNSFVVPPKDEPRTNSRKARSIMDIYG